MSMHMRENNSEISRGDAKENRLRVKQGQRAANARRPALGNVTNQVRRQPQRNAKDKHTLLQGQSKSSFGGQENKAPAEKAAAKNVNAVSLGGFAIFQDVIPSASEPRDRPHPEVVDEPMQDQENLIPENNKLNDVVAGLNKHLVHSHIPLAPLNVDIQAGDASPMVIASPEKPQQEHEAVIGKPDEFGIDPYSSDIYNYLRLRELTSNPPRDYMKKQNEITTSMRNILVDWLVEVGEEYKLHRETLFLSINYIDRFLSLIGVHRPKLQLVGTACMFIAAKYEEIYPPDVAEFVYITDDTYTRHQVLKMETVILKLLEFKVAVPTINWFCERYLETMETTEQVKNLAHFLTELSLIEIEEFLDFRPSQVAASAIVIARSSMGENPWPNAVSSMSEYTLRDLEACVNCLFRLYSRKASMPQQAVVEKYKQSKLNSVALLDPPQILAIY